MVDSATLKLGSTPLLDDGSTVNYPYKITASPDGTTWGNAEKIITAIKSHLQDGELATVTSYGNRQGTIKVRVEAPTYDGLALGEATLMAETKVPGFSTLLWSPNVALARLTVFDVVYTLCDFDFEDFDEAFNMRRTYDLTVVMLPFGRDSQITSTTAAGAPPGVTPVFTSIDAGSSATGWTTLDTSTTFTQSSPTPTVQTNGPNTYLENSTFPGTCLKMTSTKTGSVAMGTDTIFFVDWQVTGTGTSSVAISLSWTTSGASGSADPTTSVLQASGYTRTYFTIPSGVTMTSFTVTASLPISGGNYITRLRIDQVSRGNVIPGSGTTRQQQKSLKVGGSARARVALILTAEAGKTLGALTHVYTRSGSTGFQPPLRPYITAAGSALSTSISGALNTVGSSAGTGVTYRVPAVSLRQAGYELVSYLRSSLTQNVAITYTATLKSSTGATLPESTIVATGTTTVAFTTNVWQAVDLGLVSLPTVPVDSDSTHVMEIVLTAVAGGTFEVDETWLYDLENGVLSWVDTTGLTRLEIRPADTTLSEPSYWGGTVDGGAALGLVRADYRAVSFSSHTFEPGTVETFTVTSEAVSSSLTARYYRAWHTNAGA